MDMDMTGNGVDRPLRLLSLDGGGVRGLSSLFILRSIMMEVKHKDELKDVPYPCDYFDMIAGTSTGGLIAVMLGLLRMDINDCIETYIRFSDQVFPRERGGLYQTAARPMKALFHIPRFDHKRLETLIKDLVEKHLAPVHPSGDAHRGAYGPGNESEIPLTKDQIRDTLMKFQTEGNRNPSCKVFLCTTTKKQTNLRRIRSYDLPGALGADDVECRIWEACRATTAAPTFFKSIRIGSAGVKYCDGAFKFNNPVRQLLDEARNVWGEKKIGCIVSVGTGLSKVMNVGNGLGLLSTLRSLATETEKSEETFADDVKNTELGGSYFRFNVVRGLDKVGLNEASKKDVIEVATTQYLQENTVSLQKCASQMLNPSFLCRNWPQHNHYDLQTLKELFVPPRDAWKQLENVCCEKHVDQHPRQVIIHGMPGAGKTMLADTFAASNAKRFWAVFKVDASSPTSAETGFKELARKLGIEFNRTVLTNALSDPKKPWLLVLDNMIRDVRIDEYLAIKGNATIIISTRDRKFYNGNVMGNIELNEMDLEDAITLLLKRVQIWRPRESDEGLRYSVGKLVKDDIGCLPLAILQAGAFIDSKSCSVEKFRNIFANTSDTPLNFLKVTPDEPEEPKSVWKTFQMCFQEIETMSEDPTDRHKAVNARNALGIIRFFAFLNCSEIPERILINASRKPHSATNRKGKHSYTLEVPQDNDPKALDMAIMEAIQVLEQFSLIKAYSRLALRTEEQFYSVNALVKKCVLLDMKGRSKEDPYEFFRVWLKAAYTLSSALLFNPDIRDETLQRFSSPHIESCILRLDLTSYARECEHVSPKSDLNLHLIWLHFARLFCENGRPQDAKRLQLEVIDYLKGFEDKSYYTLVALQDLATSLRLLGDQENALSMRKDVLKGFQNMQLHEDNVILDAKANLADSYADVGKLTCAIQLQTQVVEGRKSSKDPSKISASRLKLAQSLSLIGDEKGALEIRKDVVQQLIGSKNPLSDELLRAKSDLAYSYDLADNILEGRKLREDVLERRLEIESGLVASSETATDGPVNTDLLTAWIDVAVSLDAFQKYDRAREIKESVLEKREKAFGQTHPETLRARQSLALHYGRRNMLREAVEEHQKVLNASEKVYGLAHLMTLDARDEVARLRARLLWKRVKEKQINYGELEREKTALRRIREELVKDWETHFPEHHPRIWTAKNRLYDVVFKFYNHDEAQFRRDNLYKEQLAKKGEDDASTIETWMRLASGFKHMGKTAEAMKIYRQIAAYFAQGSDDKHLLALRAMAKTADLLEGQCSHKDDEEALEILKKLVKVQESLQGPDHPVVQRTKESIHGLQVKLRVDSSLFAESIDGPYKSESEEADAPGLGSRF